MINPRSIAAVCRFEVRRAATIPRMAWWLGLAGFPIVLSILLRGLLGQGGLPSEPSAVVRVEVKQLSEKGLPTIEVEGEKLTGASAVSAITRLARPPEDVQESIEKATAEFERYAKEVQEWHSNGRKGPQPVQPQPPQFFSPPILVVKHPPDFDVDDRAVKLLRTQLETPFAATVFYPSDQPEPHVQPPSAEATLWMTGLFILVPTVVSMLGVFLWATPAISAELERRSWVYLATRPNGPVSVLLGKYIVGVAWGISAALTGLAVSLWLADVPEGFMYLFGPMAVLVLLGCPAYGAIYTLIGVIMPRRAMVIAVVYSLVFEGFISAVPALINKITIQFRLRALLVHWLGLERLPNASNVLTPLGLNETSASTNIISLILLTLGALTAAVLVLRWKELSQADESDS